MGFQYPEQHLNQVENGHGSYDNELNLHMIHDFAVPNVGKEGPEAEEGLEDQDNESV